MSDLGDLAAELGSNTDTEGAALQPRIKPIGLGQTIKIRIEENDNIPPTGLFVGHNGTGYLIRAGEEVNVPIGVKGILDDAIEYVSIIDPGTRRVVGTRRKLRFPYQVIQPAA
jgi:hypothetical protein